MSDENKSENSNKILVRARWRNFHFSGKVIFCSVLFGLALLLIGGLLFVIDSGDREKSSTTNDEATDEMKQVTPPIFYVGAVFMGLGSFTIVVGTVMCLIETNVLRKRNDDARPLITAQQLDPETSLSQPRSIPPTGTKKKHDCRKKSPSPARSKTIPNKSSTSKSRRPHISSYGVSEPKAISPNRNTSPPGDHFVTPINSTISKAPLSLQVSKNSETESTQSMKSFGDSLEASLYMSGEFKTPSSSYENNNALKHDALVSQKIKNSKMNVNECSSETIFSSGEFVTPVASPSAFEVGKFHAEHSHSDKPTLATYEGNSSEQIKVLDEPLQQSTVSTIRNVIAEVEEPQIKENDLIGITQDPLKDDSVLSNAKINDDENIHSDEEVMSSNRQTESELKKSVNNCIDGYELQTTTLLPEENVVIDDDRFVLNDNQSKPETPVDNFNAEILSDQQDLGQLPTERKTDSKPKVHDSQIALEEGESTKSILLDINSSPGKEQRSMNKNIADDIGIQSSLDSNSKEINRIQEEVTQEQDNKELEPTHRTEESNKGLEIREWPQERVDGGYRKDSKEEEHAEKR